MNTVTLNMYLFIFCIISLISSAGSRSIASINNDLKDCSGKKLSYISGIKYEMFQLKHTHDDASQHCQTWGKSQGGVGSLANVPTNQVHQCLKQMITSFNRSGDDDDATSWTGYFLGGTDKNEEGVWKWGDNKIIPLKNQPEFQKWGPREPNDMGNEDCLMMLLSKSDSTHSSGTWIDIKCQHKQYFICQMDVEQTIKKKVSNKISSETLRKTLNNINCARPQPRQVNIGIRVKQECEDNERVTAWDSKMDGTKWDLENTGKDIKITVNPPQSMYTTLGEGTDLFVDHMVLKWNHGYRNGSDHKITGYGYTGELQIFHKTKNNVTNAIVFLLQQRTFADNKGWNELIRYIALIQQINTQAVMPAPKDFLTGFIKDTAGSARYRSFHYITDVALRYREKSCGNDVIWTVYPRPILLSYSQFTRLRHIRQFPKLPADVGPINYKVEEMCVVKT